MAVDTLEGIEVLWTKQQAARYFAVSPRTINRWCNDGCPRYRLPNGHPRFKRSELAAWLREHGAGREMAA